MPSILYLNAARGSALHRRRLDGIRRYAKSFRWDVVTLEWEQTDAVMVRNLMARHSFVGCIMECRHSGHVLPPRFFGHVPVVYFEPPRGPEWRGALRVACDNVAISDVAFKELSRVNPPSFAVLPHPLRASKWSDERVVAFVKRCRSAGKTCVVFPGRRYADWDESLKNEAVRAGELAEWVAALPRHCAIFAVNDHAAEEVARALAETHRTPPYDATLLGADAVDDKNGDLGSGMISSVRLDFEHSGYLAAKLLAGNSQFRESPGAGHTPSFGPLLVERRKSTAGRGRREPRILEAIETIRREACDGLTVADLAARFSGSRRLFEIRFKEAAGHSALDEILNVRMERVLTLLARPDFPIGAIADFCGFGCADDLRKRFRDRFRVSMRTWRSEHCR